MPAAVSVSRPNHPAQARAVWARLSVGYGKTNYIRNLYVIEWFREITIPVTEIAGVTESRWIKGHPITIHFKNTSICGQSVMFVPKVRLAFWSKHPVVAELQRVAGLLPDSAF